MTLLICPVRPGDSNEELRFALRSWEANLILPNLQLMTVGYCPSWLEPDAYVTANRFDSVALAVFDNVLLGAEAAVLAGHEEVIYMNDDFFCMDPVGSVLPVKRNITLAQHCALFPKGASSWWNRSLDLTASWLASEGYPSPDSYEVHRPLLAQPQAMLSALERWREGVEGWTPDLVPQWRTVYGVLNKVDAHPVIDAKLSMKSTGFGTPWVSTSDQSWRRYASMMRTRFQKPSRWEI